jgi:hypothetical protein
LRSVSFTAKAINCTEFTASSIRSTTFLPNISKVILVRALVTNSHTRTNQYTNAKIMFLRTLCNNSDILCLWFRASLIYINNCPTRCNTKQSIYYSASSLYMFRAPTIPIIRSTQNCNFSLRYWSYFLCSYLPPTWPTLDNY